MFAGLSIFFSNGSAEAGAVPELVSVFAVDGRIENI
jgi:hypothetical protein